MNLDKDTAQAFYTAYSMGTFPTLIKAFLESMADELALGRGDYDGEDWKQDIDIKNLKKEVYYAYNTDELCLLAEVVEKHMGKLYYDRNNA